MKNITNQKGVALITALMIVALASIISINISTKLQLDIRRTGNIIANDQAQLYTLAAEALAKRYLHDDISDNKIDDLNEAWAQPYIFPLEDGTLKASLTDLQACINLNTLIINNKVNTITKSRLEQLLSNKNLPIQLSQAVIDWIDDNQETTIPDGAEDDYYTNLESPYRSANNALQSISELKLIKGFEDQKTLSAIEDSLCAFGGDNTSATININTAPTEVLLSLSSKMDIPTAECIIKTREEDPFTSPAKFRSFCNLETIITAAQAAQLSVNTSNFMLETNVKIGEARVTMFSIINRSVGDNGKISVISRSQGVY